MFSCYFVSSDGFWKQQFIKIIDLKNYLYGLTGSSAFVFSIRPSYKTFNGESYLATASRLRRSDRFAVGPLCSSRWSKTARDHTPPWFAGSPFPPRCCAACWRRSEDKPVHSLRALARSGRTSVFFRHIFGEEYPRPSKKIWRTVVKY